MANGRHEKATTNTTRRHIGRVAGLVMLLVIAMLAGRVSPANALDSRVGIGGGTPTVKQKTPTCFEGISGSLRATPNPVQLWQSLTLSWSATVPSGCSGVSLYVVGPGVSPTYGAVLVGPAGMLNVVPIANTTYTLKASLARDSRTLASVFVGVNLPQTVAINANNHVPLFVQAVGTPGTTVVVASHVQLDLTGYESIGIADNVTIRGGRDKLNPGARLFTTTRPKILLNIVGDYVRITGVRIEGPDMGVVETDDIPRGIFADSHVYIEIDHSEIYGWGGAGIEVQDDYDFMPAGVYNMRGVHIHDNFIHHNQHSGGNGYGVASRYGANPVIERNTFDWNRHAISADGRPGTGYFAYSNLVLANGGLHMWIPFPGFWTKTHMFDVHGLNDCGVSDHNCGPAGHSFYIRNNTFLYTADNAIKLRGTPEVGMFVSANVFAHQALTASSTTVNGRIQLVGGAVQQTESGLQLGPGNVLGNKIETDMDACDFDGDGRNDSFMATGAGWWYSSGGAMPWAYLNTSTKRLGELQLGYFDGDGRCDVLAGGVVYPGGMQPAPTGRLPFGGSIKVY